MTKQKLKILHTNFNIGWGGQSNRVFNISKGLRNLGHDVTLVVPENSDLKKKAEEHNLDLNTNVKFKSGLNYSDFRDYSFLKALIEKNKFDIVHTHGSKDSWTGILASRTSHIKPLTVRTRHNIFPVNTHILNRMLYKKWTDEIVVICQYLKNDFLKRGIAREGHINVIHSGLIDKAHNLSEDSNDKFRKDFKISDKDIVIGMCANFVWYKGHKYLAKASGEIYEKYPNTVFVILGDGKKEIKEEVSEIFKKCGTFDRLIMPGFYKNMHSFYKTCDIIVHPALSEGCCNVVLEAFSYGVPVVASDVGGIPDMVEDHNTGILIPPKDHKSIVKGVFELLSNNSLKTSMINNARKKFHDEFTVDKMVEKTEKLYFKALNIE